VRYDDRFLDDLKSRLRLSDIIGRSVKLRRQGREFVGLSPFNKERTPSFFVNDDKGFFHDFSSGKHGDLITFLQETERLTFAEAPFGTRITARFENSAFEEADVAIWLLDATQAMKRSERAVLDEAKRARLPVQMLVNKADRLTADQLATVMAAVDEALVETGLPSWSPPLALSAKKALAGKLGDAAALEASGWAAVQARLDERIVARSDELKERSLRRRAARVVATLEVQAEAQGAQQRREDDARAAQAHAVGQAAARVERDADPIAEDLAKSLEPHARVLAQDLELVFIGRDRAAATADPVLGRYRVDRALATLAPPLARALASLVPEAGLSPARLTPFTRALVRAAASTGPVAPEALLPPLARAAVATVLEQLFALSVPPATPSPVAGRLRELHALGAALA